MNIFEQYGIKDVANVTLYGITYDKYDNEVCIPVMYFDTLKVSSVEQAADETSARGGLGNAEQVVWHYGKQLNLTLQDALYTPASQSLLWGCRFGLKPIKIKGVWKEANYPIDQYGNIQYYQRVVREDIGVTVDIDWVGFYCPCDGKLKYMTYEPIIVTPQILSGITLTRKDGGIEKEVKVKVNKEDDGKTIEIYTEDNVPRGIEKADLFINKFENFSHKIFDVEKLTDIIKVEESLTQKVKEQAYTMIEYQWENSIGQMITDNINKQQAYDENISFCIHSFLDNNNKRYIFYNKEENKYQSYYHFYKTITKELKGLEILEGGITKPITKSINFKVYLGTFYIVEDWNIDNTSEEPGINLIESGLRETSLIENTRQYSADKMFAIDVDTNIKSYNAMKDIKYAQSSLAVYIDPTTNMPYEANAHYYDCEDGTRIWGNLRIFKQDEIYLLWSRNRAAANKKFLQTIVRVQDYPNVFKIVGETFVRDRYGEDQLYQIEIPICYLENNFSLNLEASGEPSVVDMKFKVLAQVDGTLAKLTLYNEEKDECKPPRPTLPIVPEDKEVFAATILFPFVNDIYCLAKDCRIKEESYNTDNINESYLRLPKNNAEAAALAQEFQEDQAQFAQNHKEILLIKTTINGKFKKYLTQEDNVELSLTFNTGSDGE